MAPPSKTVCLRAFNEDLDGTNPWERKPPTPPPLPKRIAWPGGKIVSNKDEALASFLRRKLDQGHSLTPEQMAMLERMVDPSAAASGTAARDGIGSRAGGKRKAQEAVHGGGGVGGSADARNLLQKLERKVASTPGSSGAVNGSGFHGLGTSRRDRGKVDLSSLKQNRGGNKAMGGRPGGDGGGRRVIPDGRGGFTIATTPQAQDFNSNKRSRGFEGGGGGGRGAAVAAVAAAIPAVYREAGFSVSNLPSGKKLSGGKGRGAVGMKGKKVPAQQQNWRGKGATKAKGLSNGGGGGGAKEERSLEDLMFGGLAAVRR